jgi:hypothetical protein
VRNPHADRMANELQRLTSRQQTSSVR